MSDPQFGMDGPRSCRRCDHVTVAPWNCRVSAASPMISLVRSIADSHRPGLATMIAALGWAAVSLEQQRGAGA